MSAPCARNFILDLDQLSSYIEQSTDHEQQQVLFLLLHVLIGRGIDCNLSHSYRQYQVHGSKDCNSCEDYPCRLQTWTDGLGCH
jgi:hypothetical protein